VPLATGVTDWRPQWEHTIGNSSLRISVEDSLGNVDIDKAKAVPMSPRSRGASKFLRPLSLAIFQRDGPRCHRNGDGRATSLTCEQLLIVALIRVLQQAAAHRADRHEGPRFYWLIALQFPLALNWDKVEMRKGCETWRAVQGRAGEAASRWHGSYRGRRIQ